MRHRVVDLDGPVHYIDFGGDGEYACPAVVLIGSALDQSLLHQGSHLAADRGRVAVHGLGERPSAQRPPEDQRGDEDEGGLVQARTPGPRRPVGRLANKPG